MKLKAIIVDDEMMARNFLERYCDKYGDISLMGSFPDAASALEFLKLNEVDILFLDVEMPGFSGFELLDQLTYMPKVILTTAKTDYAYNAFQYNVADYLKKPIPYNRFQEAMGKVSVNNEPVNPEKLTGDIFIKSDGKFTRLNFQDILYIEGMGDYVKYITHGKIYMTHSTLKAVEEKMAGTHFMKVHRSYIVNLQKIKDIQDHSLVIEGKVIPISKVLKPEFMDRIKVI